MMNRRILLWTAGAATAVLVVVIAARLWLKGGVTVPPPPESDLIAPSGADSLPSRGPGADSPSPATRLQELTAPPTDGSGDGRQTPVPPGLPEAPTQPTVGTDKRTLSASRARPPGIDEEDPPLSLTGQISRFMKQARAESGPEAVKLGRRLLAADNPMLRAAGAAILSEFGALDEAALQAIAADPDPAVAVNVLGWLGDSGADELSRDLAEAIRDQGLTASDVIDLVLSDSLNAAGGRAALELIAEDAPPEQSAALYAYVTTNNTQAYSVRMKAAVLLADTMSFEEYRKEINSLQDSASAEEDPLWAEGITRLAHRLEGPAEVMATEPSLSPSDIEEMLAREYPMTLEDLAQQVEYVTGKDDAVVTPGTAAVLEEHLEQLDTRPWTEDQQSSLLRLHNLVDQLAAMETNGEASPTSSSAPPGAD